MCESVSSVDVAAILLAELAVCGPSSKFDDPSNDPANVAAWDDRRDVRAEPVRWIFVNPCDQADSSARHRDAGSVDRRRDAPGECARSRRTSVVAIRDLRGHLS